jgi:hypothetical protein
MDDAALTIVRCSRCGRSGQLSLEKNRFWCAWFQDWVQVQAENLQGITIEKGECGSRVVPLFKKDIPHQPLRIPAGWRVDYNNALYEIDPLTELIPEEDRWWIFKQDMLCLTHDRFNRLLNLGWYPEGDLVEGHYGLVVYEGDHRGTLLHEFTTNDRLALVAEIERLLLAVCHGEL